MVSQVRWKLKLKTTFFAAGTKTEYDAGGYGCPSSTTSAQELPNSGNVCYGLFDCNVNYSQQQLAAYDALYSNHTIGNSVSSASPCSSGNGFDNEAISDGEFALLYGKPWLVFLYSIT